MFDTGTPAACQGSRGNLRSNHWRGRGICRIWHLLVTSPVSLKDADRVAALATRTRIAAVVDDPLLVTCLARAARAASCELELLVDIDLGQHRTGVGPAEVIALAKTIAATPGMRF